MDAGLPAFATGLEAFADFFEDEGAAADGTDFVGGGAVPFKSKTVKEGVARMPIPGAEAGMMVGRYDKLLLVLVFPFFLFFLFFPLSPPLKYTRLTRLPNPKSAIFA